MPRANRRRSDGAPLDVTRALGGAPRREQHPDGAWFVRAVGARGDQAAYRCPGCQQEVSASVAHVVAWPADGVLGLDERRHWHTVCWGSRLHRRPHGSWK